MEKKQALQSIVRYGLAVLVPILIVVAALGAWFYFGKPSDFKQHALAVLGLPAGRVGSYAVGADEIMAWQEITGKLQLPDEYTLDTSIRLRAVAAGKVGYSEAEIEAAYQYLQQDPLFVSYIQSAGASVIKTTLATDYVVRYKLRQWYAQHPELEPAYGARVRAVQDALATGRDFAQVAQAYSTDSATKYFGGDLGYIDITTAVPEYAQGVRKLKKNERGIIYSRYGTHFVQLVDAAENGGRQVVRLQEIVIETSGFDAWLAGEMGALTEQWYYGK